MTTKELTNDAKCILLLCGRFGKKVTQDAAKPLSLKEYNQLADWMLERDLRPADLLTNADESLLKTAPAAIDVKRLKMLLSRGTAMALAVEKWTNNGIWVVCRSDALYPECLKQHLKKHAPPILYGVGNIDLMTRGGLAIVGSRNIDTQGEAFTRTVAEKSARQRMQIVSGGARGVDQIAMLSALKAGGTVVGVVADSLLRAAVAGKYRTGFREKRLALVSPFYPDARFNVGHAMGRNKYIYALADFALIVSAEKKKGGTWAGATEELKRNLPRPVFVRKEKSIPEGNHVLLQLGAQAFPQPPWKEDLFLLLRAIADSSHKKLHKQRSLFGEPSAEKPMKIAVKEDFGTYPAKPAVSDADGSPPLERADTKSVTSAYKTLLPLILGLMEDWRSPKDLADEFEVRKTQMDDWLKRAIDDGIVEKKKRPVRYRRRKDY